MSDKTPDRVVVSWSPGDKLAQRIQAGLHDLDADEPLPIGDDLGPDPYDLLLAALGSCVSMTLRMYAKRKQWPLEGVVVRLNYKRDHAKDCEDCERSTVRVHHFDCVVELTGNLDRAQRRRLREIAERCPVHRTLMEPKRIATWLGELGEPAA